MRDGGWGSAAVTRSAPGRAGLAAERREVAAAVAETPWPSLAHPAARHRRSLANGAASGVCRILGRDVETLPRQGARTQAWRAQLSKTDRGLHIAFVPYLYNDTTRRVHWALNRGP